MRVPRKRSVIDLVEKAARPRVALPATPLAGGAVGPEGPPGEEGPPGVKGDTGAQGLPGAGLPEGVVDWGEVTSLPGGAGKGDRCLYKFTFDSKVYVWPLVKTEDDATYPWVPAGALPLVHRVAAAGQRNSATFGNCTAGTTTVPAVKAPLKGLYVIDHGVGFAQAVGAASTNALISIEVGGTAATDADAAKVTGIQQFEGSGASAENIEKTLTASMEVKQKYRGHTVTTTWEYTNRWVRATPVKLG
jgi:hypothetical protein